MSAKFRLLIFFFLPLFCHGQNLNSEDSLSTEGKKPATFLGGYGNVLYTLNSNEKQSKINLERVVLFIGHRFNDKFSFVSEFEIEDAKVSGNEDGGEVAIEQAYLKFNVSRNSYLTAGLFLPRIGILNENHLPNAFNGNERTQIETFIIPSTWRELGVGFYTRLNALPVNLSFAILNGLDNSAFENGTVIREGRYEGREASANCLAVTASAQYDWEKITFQVSGYAGGSVGISTTEAELLDLDSGPFGTPVILGEGDATYKSEGFSLKCLATFITIPDAGKINDAYSNNTPKSAYGIYAEAAYDILYKSQNEKKHSLNIFGRYEKMNLNASVPGNGIEDDALNQQHFFFGMSYLPIPQIAIKADVHILKTGNQNPVLQVPNSPRFKKSNTFVNLGFGFSF